MSLMYVNLRAGTSWAASACVNSKELAVLEMRSSPNPSSHQLAPNPVPELRYWCRGAALALAVLGFLLQITNPFDLPRLTVVCWALAVLLGVISRQGTVIVLTILSGFVVGAMFQPTLLIDRQVSPESAAVAELRT